MPQTAHNLKTVIRIKLRRQVPKLGKVVPQWAKAALHRRRYLTRLDKAWERQGGKPDFLPSDCRVNAIVAGAQKAGTTALMSWLSQHPEVVTPVLKEPHFFDNLGFFNQGHIAVKAYHRAFAFRGKDKLYIEGTPETMFAPEYVERVHQYNPSAKLICILRDPTDRAFSAWNMNSKRLEERDLATLFDIEKEKIQKDGIQTRGHLGYLSRGLYAQQIQQLLRWFPKEQLLFLSYDNLHSDNLGTFKKVCTFLGIAGEAKDIQMDKKNVIPYERTLDPVLEKKLRDWFRPEVTALEQLLEWDLSHWK